MQKVAFVDSLGNVFDFVIKANFNVGYNRYVALSSVDEIYFPTLIMKVEQEEYGEETLVSLDEDELDSILSEYEKVRKDNYQ